MSSSSTERTVRHWKDRHCDLKARTGFADAKVTADSALLLGKGERSAARQGPTLGLCISTQRQVADLEGLKGLIAAVRGSGARVLGIPMNPKTDRALLASLGVDCIPGTTPEAVMDAAAACDVVLSSRLHLLILAANAGTPGLGIARGSKLANWPEKFISAAKRGSSVKKFSILVNSSVIFIAFLPPHGYIEIESFLGGFGRS